MDFSKLPDKITTSRRQLETNDENAVVKWAEAQGILVTKLTAIGRRGFPDRIFWIDGGKPVMIEFKSPGQPPTKLQTYWHDKLRKLGYEVECCDTKEQAINFIRRAVEAAPTGIAKAPTRTSKTSAGKSPKKST